MKHEARRMKRWGHKQRLSIDDAYDDEEMSISEEQCIQQDLDGILSKLSDMHKLYLELRFDCEYTYMHMAKIVGSSFQTAYNRTQAALKEASRFI